MTNELTEYPFKVFKINPEDSPYYQNVLAYKSGYKYLGKTKEEDSESMNYVNLEKNLIASLGKDNLKIFSGLSLIESAIVTEKENLRLKGLAKRLQNPKRVK